MAVMEKIKRKQGFTLIEIVVVMAILALLAVLIMGAILIARRTSRDAKYRNDAKTVRDLLEGYYKDNKRYPPSAGTISRTNAYSFFDSTVTPNTNKANANQELRQYLGTSTVPTGDSDRLCYSMIRANGQDYYLWFVTEAEANKSPAEGCDKNGGGWPGANTNGAIHGPNMTF